MLRPGLPRCGIWELVQEKFRNGIPAHLPPPSAARNLSCDFVCQATPSGIQRLQQRAQSVPKNLYSDAHQQE